jgi:ribosomal protein L24
MVYWRVSLILSFLLSSSLEHANAFTLPQNGAARTNHGILSATIMGRSDSRVDPFEQWEYERKMEMGYGSNQYYNQYPNTNRNTLNSYDSYNTRNSRYQPNYNSNSYVDRVNNMAPYNRQQSANNYPRSQFDQNNMYNRYGYNQNSGYNSRGAYSNYNTGYNSRYQQGINDSYSYNRREPYNNGLQAGFDYNSGTFISNDRKNRQNQINQRAWDQRKWSEPRYYQGHQGTGMSSYSLPQLFEGDRVHIARGPYSGQGGTVVRVFPKLVKVQIGPSDTVFVDIKDIENDRQNQYYNKSLNNNNIAYRQSYGQYSNSNANRSQQSNALTKWDPNSAYGPQRNAQYANNIGRRQQNNALATWDSNVSYGQQRNAQSYRNINERNWNQQPRYHLEYRQHDMNYADSPLVFGDTVHVMQGTHAGKKGTVKKVFPGMVSVKFGENETVLVSNKDIDFDKFYNRYDRSSGYDVGYNQMRSDGNTSWRQNTNNGWSTNSMYGQGSRVSYNGSLPSTNRSYQNQRAWRDPYSGTGSLRTNSPFSAGDSVRVAQGAYSGKTGIVKKVFPGIVSVQFGDSESVLIDNKNIDFDQMYYSNGRSDYGVQRNNQYGGYNQNFYNGRNNGQYISNRSTLMSQNQRQPVYPSQRKSFANGGYENNAAYGQSNTALWATPYNTGEVFNSHFNKGDKVQIMRGSYAGRTATVLNYFLDGIRLSLSQPGKTGPSNDIIVEERFMINLDDIYRMNGAYTQGYAY